MLHSSDHPVLRLLQASPPIPCSTRRLPGATPLRQRLMQHMCCDARNCFCQHMLPCVQCTGVHLTGSSRAALVAPPRRGKVLSASGAAECGSPELLPHGSDVLRPHAATAADDGGARIHPTLRMLGVCRRQDEAVCREANRGSRIAAVGCRGSWAGTWHPTCCSMQLPGVPGLPCLGRPSHGDLLGAHAAEAWLATRSEPGCRQAASVEAAAQAGLPASYSAAGGRHASLRELLPPDSHSARGERHAHREAGRSSMGQGMCSSWASTGKL